MADTYRAFLPIILKGSILPGKVYYVAKDGHDSNPGTADSPWRTIQKAAQTLEAGESVLIRGGEYISDNSISPRNSGNPDDGYITFKAYPDEPVIIRGNGSVHNGIYIGGKSYIAIEGLTIREFYHGILCQAPGHHITIRNNVFEYNLSSGILSAGHIPGTTGNACDYLTIEGNVVHHTGYHKDGSLATGPGEGWGSGIAINPNGNPYVTDTDYSRFHSVIRGNYIYHNRDGTGGDVDDEPDHAEGHGIIIDRGGNLPPMLIENNVIFDNGGMGIHLYGAQNIWVIGNTLYKNTTEQEYPHRNAQAEISVYDVQQPYYEPAKNIHVLNNVAYALGDRQITYFPHLGPGDLTMKNNLWYGHPFREVFSPRGEDYMFADPLFVNASVDPAAADFHLRPDSPGIDRGTNDLKPGSQLVDFDGTIRPQRAGYDISAYEYAAESP